MPVQFTDGRFHATTDAGAPLANGRLYTYVSGTTTFKATYTDYTLGTPNTYVDDGTGQLYIALNARGEAAVWPATDARYTFVLKTSAGVTVWTSDGEGGATPLDELGSTASGKGTSLVGSNDAGGYFTATTAEGQLQEIGGRIRKVAYVTDPAWGADNTGATDCASALSSFQTYIAANASQVVGVFPPGIYKFSAFPTFAIQDAVIVNDGEVRLRYTGTGIAVDLDGGAAGGGVTKVVFGQGNGFIIECPSTATNALRVRAVHHSKIYARLQGAGSTSAALKTQWCVCTEFYTPCSEVDEPWYLGAAPAIGWDLDQRGASEQTSYCTFIQPLVEHPAVGIKLTSTLGNVFLGGTSEGCATYGLQTTANAFKDKFIGTDFEANGVDCFIQGSQIHMIGCDTETNITFGGSSRYCVMTGGVHQTVLNDTGASFNRFGNFTYNQLATTGTFTDAGSGTILDAGIVNGNGGAAFLTGSKTYDPPSVASLNAVTTTVTVSGAALGDTAIASFSISTASFIVSAQVTAADTVTVGFLNITGGAVDLASGTLKVNVFRR